MKANEAPEKIYVHRSLHLGLLTAAQINITGSDIEYTRTDAFIEKACEWLKFNYTEYTNNTRLGIKIDELIKDFKKAMEE